ncbi:MAG: FxLYD domain-containing protein [Planctomycetota bacterium]|jgi:hypothetical protein
MMLARTSAILVAALLGGSAMSQEAPPAPGASPTQPERTIPEVDRDPIDVLLEEVDRLLDDVMQLRRELATAKLAAAEAQRELKELRQFIRDHHEFGSDFQQYKGIREIADREARQREAEASRERWEAEKAARRARYQAARAERAQERGNARRVERYADAGFTPLGLDVFVGRMAFFYPSEDKVPYRYDYRPGFGRYQRFYPPYSQIDYSTMTISGSVLNGSEEVRHIGIAITFFDESGNQVGGETVQVSNARPNVPYPFTATLDMALDRPFDSTTTYVLYADPADQGEPLPPPPPNTQPQQGY